jgi:hypothetical protein
MVDLRELVSVLFEALTILAAVRAGRRFGVLDDEVDGPPLGAILITAGSLCVSALLATVFCFLHLNSVASYLAGVTALLLGLSAPRPRDLADDVRWLWQRWSRLARDPLFRATALAAVVLLGPALLVCMRPLLDGDSTLAMGSVLTWCHNSATPYAFAFYGSYPTVWELCFVPGLVTSASDQWIWWVGLKAAFLLGAAACAIGRRLGLSRGISLLLALSVTALRPLWWPEASGVGTLKNDTIVAAGFLLIVLSLLELGERNRRRNAVLMVLGCIWITAKFSGLAPAAPAVVVWFGWMLWRRLMTPRAAAGWAAAGAVAWLALSGHFYVHNLVAYHNPLYPAVLAVHGHVIAPGPYDLHGTSILHNIRDRRLPGIVADAPSRLGPAIWFSLVIALLGAVATIGRALWPGRGRRCDWPGLVVSTFILCGWVWYASMYYSAGLQSGDLQYVQHLLTARYAMGPLVLTEVWSAVLLARWTGHEVAATVLAAFSLGGRWLVLGALLFGSLYGVADLVTTVLLTAVLLIGWALARRAPLRGLPVLTAVVMTAAVLWGAPSVVERRREQGWEQTGGGRAWHSWADRAPSRFGVIQAELGWAPVYRLAGRRLQHEALVYAAISDFERDPDPPALLAYLPHPSTASTPAGIATTVQVASAMLRRGYTPLDFCQSQLLAERRATGPDAAIVAVSNMNGTEFANGTRFWWLGAGTTKVFVWSRQSALLRVTLRGEPGPNAGPGAAGRLRVTDASGASQVVTVLRTPVAVRVRVPAGASPIALDALDMSTPVSSADVRPLVMSLSDLAVAVQPAETAPASAASLPCSFDLTNGWYPPERGNDGWLRWSAHSGEIRIVSPGGGPVTLAGEFASVTRGNTVDLALDGRVVTSLTTRTERFAFEPVGPITLLLPPGGGRLTATSRKPGIVVPPDTRQLGFALRNLTVAADSGACTARF